MLIGYCRVSTADQNLEFQLEELKRANCEKIFQDVSSGAKTERKGLDEALEFARNGDVLVVWKLDRLGRSLKHLIQIVNDLQAKGVGFRCLTQNLDTTSPSGMLVFQIFGAIAEFERSLIQERTLAGLKAARARGRKGGRPKLLDRKKISIALALHADGQTPVSEICKTLSISRPTFYRYLSSAKAA